MINKYVKIIDPDHQYFGETFLVFFEGIDSKTVRGQGIHLTLKSSQVEEGKREDYISVKPGTALESFIKQKEIQTIQSEISIKIEDTTSAKPDATISTNTVNANEQKVLLSILSKIQEKIADTYSIALPARTVVGIVKIYFEEISKVDSENFTETVAELVEAERIIKMKTFIFTEQNGHAIITLSEPTFEEACKSLERLVWDILVWRCEDEEGEEEGEE